MYSGLVVAIVFVTCVIIFLIYKRHMVAKLFSLDIADQVSDFEDDIQETARVAVDKISIAAEDLAILLDQAEEIIEELKIRVKIAEDQLYKYSLQDMKNNLNIQEFTPKNVTKADKQPFSQHLIDATQKTSLHLNTVAESNDIIEDENQLVKRELFSDDNIIDFPNDVYEDDGKSLEKQQKIVEFIADGYDDEFIAKTLNASLTEVKLTRKFSNN